MQRKSQEPPGHPLRTLPLSFFFFLGTRRNTRCSAGKGRKEGGVKVKHSSAAQFTF